MAGLLDKFTERARRVLTLAEDEARRFNHNYIGTEHILLGLARDGDGVAMRVLSHLGITAAKVRSGVEFIISRGEKSTSDEIVLRPQTKKVIELAVEEARRLNHAYIGTEHLLLGLMREGEGIAFGVLEQLGATLDALRTELARLLSQSAPREAVRGRLPSPGSGPLRLAPNSALREHALRLLDFAIVILDMGKDSELVNELLTAFVRAEIDTIIEMLELTAGTRQELDDSWSQVMNSANQLTTAEKVLRKHQPGVSDALSGAVAAVHRAISTPPAPGFRRPST